MAIDRLYVAGPKGPDGWTVGWTESGVTQRRTFNSEGAARELYARLKQQEQEETNDG